MADTNTTTTIRCPFTGAVLEASTAALEESFQDLMGRVQATADAREAAAAEETEHRAIMATLPG